MIVGLLKEPQFEKRVALLPEAVAVLRKLNVDVMVETNAGVGAYVSDADYQAAGASLVSRDKVFFGADVLIKINALTTEDVNACKPNQVVLSGFKSLSKQGAHQPVGRTIAYIL